MRNSLLIAILAGAAVLLAAAVTAAQAANVTVNATVSGGATLSVAGTGTPAFNLTLTGDDQTTSYTLPVQIVDARGLASGGGWNVSITSTQFKDASTHTFPTSASTITTVAVACTTGSTCTLPTNSVANTNLAVPAGVTAPTAVKFLNAANVTGLGRIDVNATVSVAVPANTIAATYSSTITVAIAAGP